MRSSNLRAEYVERIHNVLDHIQVDTLENIQSVLVDFMHREDDKEFRQIIRDRIAAKINKLNSLNEAQGVMQYHQSYTILSRYKFIRNRCHVSQ